MGVHLSVDSVGDVSVNYRRAIGRQSVNYRQVIFDVALCWYSKTGSSLSDLQILSSVLCPPMYLPLSREKKPHGLLPLFKVFDTIFCLIESICDSYSIVGKKQIQIPFSFFMFLPSKT